VDSLLDGARDATFVLNAQGELDAANAVAERLLGWSSDELHGKSFLAFIPERFHRIVAHRPTTVPADTPSDPPTSTTITLRALRRDGTEVPVEITRHPLGNGESPCTLVTLRDVSSSYRAREALLREKEVAVSTLASIGDGVLTTDLDGNVTYLNAAAERLSGWRMFEAKGHPISLVMPLISETSRLPVEGPIARCLREQRSVESPDGMMLLRRDGTEMPFGDSASPIREIGGRMTGAVLVFHDTSERRRISRALAYDAAHDPLTGVANRTALERQLARVLAEVRAGTGTEVEHVLCYFDLDRFKVINDTGGHAVGDVVLRRVVEVIGTQLRRRDTLARVGGDEFVALLEHCTLDEADRIAEACCAAIDALRVTSGDHTFSLGVSVGMVPITRDIERTADLLKLADAMCYQAKRSGGGRVQVAADQAALVPPDELEARRTARTAQMAQQGELLLHVRPILSLHPEHDARPRCELVLHALEDQPGRNGPAGNGNGGERSSVGPEVNRWIVSQVVRLLARWRTTHYDDAWPLCIVPLSSAALQDERLVPLLGEVLSEHGVPPSTLSLQVAEADALGNVPAAHRLATSLASLGSGLALSDCGKSLDAFTHLATLPIQQIIVCGSHVARVTRDPIHAGIIRALAEIGMHRDITTIAPLVDTGEMVMTLRALGIGYVSGDAIGPLRPLVGVDGLVEFGGVVASRES
jgi:diguanylate cyclase (GGDEF)-like protein/PAS domain S-box-containing protein